MATELRKLGAEVEEGADYIRSAPAGLQPAAIDTYDDHRMAMCFAWRAWAAAGAHQRPEMREQDLPGYFEAFAQVAGRCRCWPSTVPRPPARARWRPGRRGAGLALPGQRRSTARPPRRDARGRRADDEAGVAALAAALPARFEGGR